MSDTLSITTALKAETLLSDSHILKQIENLRTSLRYKTDHTYVSFDDMFLSLESQIDDLPKLKLAPAVPTGTENQYIVQLITSLEQVLDDCDRVGQKVIHYEAKLKDAAVQIKSAGTAFGVWYTLAAADLLTLKYGGLIIPLGQLKELAKTEFNRLMENSETQVNSLISAVKATTDRLKLHKKTQQDKFNLGKDQANASWTSSFPAFGNTVSESDATQLVDRGEEEVEEVVEEIEEAPAFVNTTPKVTPEEKFEPIKFEPAIESMRAFGQTVFIAAHDRNAMKPDKPIGTVTEVRSDPERPEPRSRLQVHRVLKDPNPDRDYKFTEAVSDAPVSVQTFTGPPGPITTVAVVPDEKYDALKEAVKSGPVDAKTFANLLSDEPVKVKTPKVPKDPNNTKAKTPTTAPTFVLPNSTIVIARVKDGQPEKIKCVVCDRRVRIGQMMFERDGGWAHAMSTECGATQHAPTTGQMTLSSDAPPTKPLESAGQITLKTLQDAYAATLVPGTLVHPELMSIDYTQPAAPDSIPLGTTVPETSTNVPVLSTGIPDTIVEQMIKEHPVLATLNPTLAVKAAMNTPVDNDELNDLISEAQKVVMSPEDKEEQRRSFAAGNLAIDSNRSYEEVRKDVDKAADATGEYPADSIKVLEGMETPVKRPEAFVPDVLVRAPATLSVPPLTLPVELNIPPRKRIAFLEDDGAVI